MEYRFGQAFLRFANGLLSLAVGLALVLGGLYAGYALWDNSRIYSAADDLQDELQALKPVITPTGPDFSQIWAVNPEVCAWVTLDGTRIDHPVLQGSNNLSYLNTDLYGEFSLAGSIYLDAGNERDFSDRYNLLYGHHMENGRMFGDLERYEEAAFFDANTTGTLLLPTGVYALEIVACLQVEAGEGDIFDVNRWKADAGGLLTACGQKSLQVHQETLQQLQETGDRRLLAFSTCAEEFTDARTVVLAWIKTE